MNKSKLESKLAKLTERLRIAKHESRHGPIQPLKKPLTKIQIQALDMACLLPGFAHFIRCRRFLLKHGLFASYGPGMIYGKKVKDRVGITALGVETLKSALRPAAGGR